MNRNNRVKYIDILRAIAIILVIAGHIPYADFSADFHKWVYAFHIPLFFFVSGISLSFINYSKTNFKELLSKRFHRIYLPYLVWGILLAIPNFSLWTIPKILYGTHKSLASVTNSSLWFLPVLFISLLIVDTIIILLTKKKATSKLPLFLIGFLILALITPSQPTIHELLNGHNLPLGIDIVPMTIVFILLGYLYQNCKKISNLRPKLYVSIPIILVMFLITLFFGLKNDVNYVLMAENRYGNYLFFLIAALAGIIASLLLSFIIEKYTKCLAKLMQKIGSDTMLIFILHKYPLQWSIDLLALFTTTHVSNWIVIPYCILFTVPICMLFSYLINKYAPILAGKQKLFH